MHDSPKPLFHRDICWPNIILSPKGHMRWLLINWDDAAMAPTHAAKHLDPKSHFVACFQDNHRAEVDIWGVGKLHVSLCLVSLINWWLLACRWSEGSLEWPKRQKVSSDNPLHNSSIIFLVEVLVPSLFLQHWTAYKYKTNIINPLQWKQVLNYDWWNQINKGL